MKTLILSIFILSSFHLFAQTDTVFSNGKKIPCMVKEITPDAIKYSYSGEDLINSIYVSSVQKIIFKSGRVQTFSESKSYSEVVGAEDFEKVTLTKLESDIKGFLNLGDVSAKEQAGTAFANMEKIKGRVTKRIKIQAAMMGANIVYINLSKTTGYSMGRNGYTDTKEGVAYSNMVPDYEGFSKLIGDKKNFQTIERVEFSVKDDEFDKKNYVKNVKVSKFYKENGLLMINAEIQGIDESTFRVTNYSPTSFTLVWKNRNTLYNYIIKI